MENKAYTIPMPKLLNFFHHSHLSEPKDTVEISKTEYTCQQCQKTFRRYVVHYIYNYIYKLINSSPMSLPSSLYPQFLPPSLSSLLSVPPFLLFLPSLPISHCLSFYLTISPCFSLHRPTSPTLPYVLLCPILLTVRE